MIYIVGDKQIQDCVSLSLLKFDYFDVDIDLDMYDSIVFTSKNGVEGIDKISPKWKQKEIYSIGSATTKYINSKGCEAYYEAKEAYGDTFANEIIHKLQDKRVLYPRAKKVVSSLIDTMKNNNINITDIIIYETTCNKNKIALEKNSIFIFSSPSTIECFFGIYEWDSSYKAISIGTKTAQYIPSYITPHISPKQTIEECVEYARGML